MAKKYPTASKPRRLLCKSSLVLGIIGIVFAPIMPLVTYSCSITGLVLGLNKRHKQYNSTPGIILNIVALSAALINSLIGVVMTIRLFLSEEKELKK